MEHEKQRRQARIKQQHDLNSRLSVKKSALSKMLDAQRRKERIMNPPKPAIENVDRESGTLFRGAGARNR